MNIPNKKTGQRKRKNRPTKRNKNIFGGFLGNFFIVVLIFILLSHLTQLNLQEPEELPSITEVVESINQDEIESILVSGLNVDITYNTLVDGEKKQVRIRKDSIASFDETLLNLGVDSEKFSQLSYKIEKETGFGVFLRNFLPFLFPILILLVFVWFLLKQSKGGGMQIFNFGRSRAKFIDPNDKKQRVTFKDVAGDDEAKQELQEFIDFLKRPEKFLAIGAKIPKGILLSGAPGTGKTLLARAVAGEASVPFFSISGSEFVEMFVGVGASRVRDLFDGAKKMAPAIIFIDEIDAVGRIRGSGLGGGNDEREQALNQILVEMDGFSQNDKVIVLASTNRPDILDPALLRPGRFDRKVIMQLPDIKARKEILQVHSKNKKLNKDVNFETIARRTPGLSGADLAAVINEAGIFAVRNNREEINLSDLLVSIEKVLYGPERKSRIITDRERKIIAYHEAGHAIVSSVLPYADPVQKITIVGRGNAGGYVMSMPDQEKILKSKKELFDDIAVLLGGYITEKTIFGDVTSGSSSDLEKVTQIAEAMVKNFGMTSSIPPMSLSTKNLGYGSDVIEHSQENKKIMDGEIQKIVKGAYKIAEDIIKKYRKPLDALVTKLFEVETLERDEFEKFLKENGVPIENAYSK